MCISKIKQHKHIDIRNMCVCVYSGIQPHNWKQHVTLKHLLSRFKTQQNLHPQSLTWNLKMMVSKRNLLFQGLIFRFHVKLPGCSGFSKDSTCLILQFQAWAVFGVAKTPITATTQEVVLQDAPNNSNHNDLGIQVPWGSPGPWCQNMCNDWTCQFNYCRQNRKAGRAPKVRKTWQLGQEEKNNLPSLMKRILQSKAAAKVAGQALK